MRNQFQVVFFNSKKLLQKAFFAKFKIDHCKWPFVIKKACKGVFFSLLKICRYRHQKIRIFKPYSRKTPFYKIMKNSQVGADNLGRTADFVISLFFNFLNHFFNDDLNNVSFQKIEF